MEHRDLPFRVLAACLATACFFLLATCGGEGGGQPGLSVLGEQWTRTYDGSASSVQPTADGGYIVAGSTGSFGAGDADAWLLKLDSSGNVIWQKTYGGASTDLSHYVRQTADGGYIVAGETASFPTGIGLDCLFDAWILKLDASGNVIWQKTYGGAHCDSAEAVQETSDGGYIVAGSTRSFGAGNSDAWVLKLDSSGNVVWQKTYGGTDYDLAHFVQLGADDGYIVAGDTESPYASGFDAWILKLDSRGDVIWQKTYGGAGSDAAYSVQPTGDGGYIVAGSLQTFDERTQGPREAWVFKLDAGGSIVWQVTYGGPSFDEARSVLPTADGGYIVAATTQSFGVGNPAAWLLKLDASGKVMWQRAYGGPASGFNAVQTTADGGYAVAGHMWVGSFPPHPGPGMGHAVAWIARLGATGEITSCALGGTIGAAATGGNAITGIAVRTVAASSATTTTTTIIPGNSAAVPLQQCP